MTKQTTYHVVSQDRVVTVRWQDSQLQHRIRKTQGQFFRQSELQRDQSLLVSKKQMQINTVAPFLIELSRRCHVETGYQYSIKQLAQIFNITVRSAKLILNKWKSTQSKKVECKLIRHQANEQDDRILQLNLIRHAHLSLKSRVQFLNQQASNDLWNCYRLRQAYVRLGIKYKQVVVNKPFRRNQNEQTIAADNQIYRDLMNKVNWIQQSNHELIFVDECMFSHKCFMRRAWSQKGQNLTQTVHLMRQNCLAVVGAASSKRGLICWDHRLKSIDSETFIQFLKMLRKKTYGNRRLFVLLDNCAIHKTDLAKAEAHRLNIDLNWIVPYQPQMNGIEMVWSMAKRRFKQDIIRQMIGTTVPEEFSTTVARVFRGIDQQSTKRCCVNGLKQIREWCGHDIN